MSDICESKRSAPGTEQQEESQITVKLETEDSEMIKIKVEDIDDEDGKMKPIEVGSDYSDWSDGEDDVLLQQAGNDSQQSQKHEQNENQPIVDRVVVKEELDDSIDCKAVWFSSFLFFKLIRYLCFV